MSDAPVTSVSNIDLDVPDLVLVPDGRYQVMLNSAPQLKDQIPGDEKRYGGTGQYIQAYLEIIDHSEAAMISHIMSMPHEQSDQRESESRRRAIRQFCEAFEIDIHGDPINFEEGVGQTTWVIVGNSPGKGEFGPSNRIRSYIKE